MKRVFELSVSGLPVYELVKRPQFLFSRAGESLICRGKSFEEPTMRLRRLILMVLFSLFLRGPIYGQDVKSCIDGTKTDDGNWKTVPCNGISVGLPKVFDNRTLTLQLEKLKQQLNQQQSQNVVIDLKSVAAALTNLQGLSRGETSTVLSVTGSPTPPRN